VEQAEFLEQQFDLSDAVPSCVLVATDALVPTEGKWQTALAAWLQHGRKFLQRTHYAAGRVTAPDAELYAIQIGLGLATAVPGAKSIKLFTDHFAIPLYLLLPSSLDFGCNSSIAAMSTHSGGSSNLPWGDREEDDDEMNLFGPTGDDAPMASPLTSRTVASPQFPPEPSTPTPKMGKGKKRQMSAAAQFPLSCPLQLPRLTESLPA
jgi:hypothetical protein